MRKKALRIKLKRYLGGKLSLTLLVEKNANIESFYKLNLSTWLGLETVTKNKAEAALTFLESEHDKINLIITRATIGQEETAKIILAYLEKKSLKISVVVIGPGKEVPGSFAHVPNSLQIKIMIQGAAKALNITAKEMTNKIVPDYFPIAISYFHVLKRSVCPVYAQDLENPKKFNLVLQKLDDFEEKTIIKMSSAGVTHLFVDKMDRLEFVNNVTSELMSKLAKSDVSEDEHITATDKGIELLSKKLQAIGVTDETVELAKKNLETLRANVKGHPKLSKLLDRLLKNKTSYVFKHTQILTYICLHIIQNIDWGNDEQEEKIAFIAFFHDIVLENDAQAMIKSTLELKKSPLTPPQKILVDKHAQMAAELVQKFPHAPMGSDQIIRQHHGTLNGIGFSEHYGNNVSPVAIVFIVAEEFTRIIMKQEGANLNKTELLRELKEEFPTSRFQKVIEQLQNIIL